MRRLSDRDTLAEGAPLLVVHGGIEYSLPDPRARVSSQSGRTTARWPDGVELVLHRRGATLMTEVRTAKPLLIDHVGVRLTQPGADRILVDGFQSWDWAGVRDATTPGFGWWGAVWGTDSGRLTRVRLAHAPQEGAVALRWRMGGCVEILTSGEPDQLPFVPAKLTPLDRWLQPGDRALSDAIEVGECDLHDPQGAGLPRLTRGEHQPLPRRSGWMSWNGVGGVVTAADILDATRLFTRPGGIVLLDDGWARCWGDWDASPRFGAEIPHLARAVSAIGAELGLWVAPFLVDPGSVLAARHPEWMLRRADGTAVLARRAPSPHLVLDASLPAVRAHLARLGRDLGRAGIGCVKLDFLYGAALPGVRSPGWSGMRALREGVRGFVAAYRRAAPPNAIVIACGAPAPPLVGLVDCCRSGADSVFDQPGGHTPSAFRGVMAEDVLAAQRRNAEARAWLWGSTMPCDPDAFHVGPVGWLPSWDDATVEQWIRLMIDAGGPVLDADHPAMPPPLERLALLWNAQSAVDGTPPIPRRTGPPLAPQPSRAQIFIEAGLGQRIARPSTPNPPTPNPPTPNPPTL